MANDKISKSVLQRLPIYLGYLKALPKDSPMNISATTIAQALNLGEVQVRKDLASASSSGKPKIGYIVMDLIDELEIFLGYNKTVDAIIIGAGKLGTALLNYDGFTQYGLNIVAAFDNDYEKIRAAEWMKPIYHISELGKYLKDKEIKIGIITVPSLHAQEAANLLTENGIQAIWNFAPIHLDVEKHILVQNENMASSLALLSNHLSGQRK